MSAAVTLRHYVDGERLSAPVKFDSLNPSNTHDVVAHVPDGDAAAVNAAVAAAMQAFPSWSQASPETRSDILDRISALIFERKDELAQLLAREEGKTLSESAGEVARAARIFRFFAGEALRRTGVTVDSTRPGVEAATYREAIGVFGLISPWNFPIAIPAWKSAPALAFGNTVVLKPSELTPALTSALADIVHAAGMPKGVFNVVFGAGAAGGALVEHPDVAGVSFTGSQVTGREDRAGRGCAPGAHATRDGRQECARGARRRRSRARRAMRARRRFLRDGPALHGFESFDRHECGAR